MIGAAAVFAAALAVFLLLIRLEAGWEERAAARDRNPPDEPADLDRHVDEALALVADKPAPKPHEGTDLEIGLIHDCRAYLQVNEQLVVWGTWQDAARAATGLSLVAGMMARFHGATPEQLEMVSTAALDQLRAQLKDPTGGPGSS